MKVFPAIKYPFFSILFSPRKTLRNILNSGSEKYVVFLIISSWLINGLTKILSSQPCLNNHFFIKLLILFLTLALAIPFVHLWCNLLKWTGSWLGGKGTQRSLFVSAGWGLTPLLAIPIIWTIMFVFFRDEYFLDASFAISSNLFAGILYFILIIFEAAARIWALVLPIVLLSEVQSFSVWKAILNIILSGLIIATTTSIIVLLLFLPLLIK